MTLDQRSTTKRPADEVCTVRLDRLIFNGWDRQGVKDVPRGYKRISDFRPHGPGASVNFERIQKLRSMTNSAEIRIAYKPRVRWVAPHWVTMIADDQTGLTPEEIQPITSRYHRHVLSLVELAVDFNPESGVDREFVLRHGRFGKSRRRVDRGGPDSVRFGGRSCPKLIRCYPKKGLGCFRVEAEIHRSLLRKHRVDTTANLGTVAVKLLPVHLKFVAFRWKKLEAYLNRKFGPDGTQVYEEARSRADRSLRAATRYLARNGVSNPHRFLAPLRINRDIREALRSWADRFLQDLWE